MVSRVRSRARSSGTETEAARASGTKAVYYSPAGGRVIGVLDARDEKYERELNRTGTAWEVAEGFEAPPDGADLSRFYVKRDPKTREPQELEERDS